MGGGPLRPFLAPPRGSRKLGKPACGPLWVCPLPKHAGTCSPGLRGALGLPESSGKADYGSEQVGPPNYTGDQRDPQKERKGGEGEASLLPLRPERVSQSGGLGRRCGLLPLSVDPTPPQTTWSAPGSMGGPSLYLHPLLGVPVPMMKLGVVFLPTHLMESSGLLTAPRRL